MKRFLRMAASAAFVLLLSACARHKIIPDVPLAQDEVRELHVFAHVRFDGVFREPLLQFYIATVTAAGFVPLFCIFCHLLVR